MEFGKQLHGFGISRFMFEQNQAVGLLLQHRMGVIEGAGLIEFRRQHVPISSENIAKQENVFLFRTH
jgi:hypothetical protein